MPETFKSKTFYFSFLLITIIIFVGLINFNRAFTTQVNVLVIPKNAPTASHNQIVENVKAIPFSLSFYDRMIQNNADVADESILEFPDYKRKAFWNSKLKIQRSEKSGVLQITTINKDKYNAEVLNREVIEELKKTIAFYYDIKNGIDFRIIDGPLTELAGTKSYYILFAESMGGGFLLAFIFSYFYYFLFKKEKKIEKISPINYFEVRKDEKLVIPEEEIVEAKNLPIKEVDKNIFQEEKPWIFSKKPVVTNFKKAAAPDNLPIAPDNFSLFVDKLPVLNDTLADAPEFIFNDKKIGEEMVEKEVAKMEEVKKEETGNEVEPEKEEKEIEKIEMPIIREATPEEVKERLNKLLSGKI